MDIRRKDGKTVIKLFKKQSTALAEALDIAETIAAQAHEAAPLAKQVADGLAGLRKLLAETTEAPAA